MKFKIKLSELTEYLLLHRYNKKQHRKFKLEKNRAKIIDALRKGKWAIA